MENQVVVKKGSRFGKFLKVVLILAAIAFVAVKVYNKFFKKQNVEALDAEADEAEAELTAAEEEAVAEVEEAPFEVSADAVIDNAENMEAAAE